MHDLPSLDSAERALEDQLGRLSPARHRINRDELMFRAGQLAGRKQVRQWRLATLTTLTMLMLGLASTTPWTTRKGGDATPTLAATTTQSPLSPAAPSPTTGPHDPAPVLRISFLAPTESLRLREQVLLRGVEALPSVRWAPFPETVGITAGSWRTRQPAGDQSDDLLWRRNLNDKSKRS